MTGLTKEGLAMAETMWSIQVELAALLAKERLSEQEIQRLVELRDRLSAA